MYRGTTPILTFTLPFDCSVITLLSIAFSQANELVLEKTLDDCTLDGNKVILPLTEDDTLTLDCTKRCVEIQLRVGCGESRLASKIIKTPIDRILKDGCLE